MGGQMEEGYMVGGKLRRRNLGIWEALIAPSSKKEAWASAGKAQVSR